MARKSTTDQQLDDLRAYVDESYLQNPANRAALAAQGAPLPYRYYADRTDLFDPRGEFAFDHGSAAPARVVEERGEQVTVE